MRLESKVALISGGAPGLGAAEATLFAREGAGVVIGDVLVEAARQVEAEINKGGGPCVFIWLDVTSEAHWQRAIPATASRFGRLDRTPWAAWGAPRMWHLAPYILPPTSPPSPPVASWSFMVGARPSNPLINHYSFGK